MADLRYWVSSALDAMQHGLPVFSTIQPIGCEVAEESIISARSDQTNAAAVAAALLNNGDFVAGFPPNIAKAIGRACSARSPAGLCQVSPKPV